jgi:hypothetical protein
MVVHLYGDDNEVVKTFTRSFVPWKMLKKAVKLSKQVNFEDLKAEDVDQIAGLVVEVFSDQFTLEDLDNGADVGEMLAVIQNIVARANGVSLNPTPPES